MEVKIEKLEKILEQTDAEAAMLFGSYVRGEDYNDIDLAVFTEESVEKIVKDAPGIFDIQRFEDLPMYIKKRVLEEGELFYCRDKSAFYDKTIDFVRRYENFKPRYEECLKREEGHTKEELGLKE